jgi:hypothetical protein
MSPEGFDIFQDIVNQFPNVQTVYHNESQLGGSYIIMEYRKEQQEFSVTYKNLKSKLKESIIILSNDDMSILKSKLSSTPKQKNSFYKDMFMEEGFHESGTFDESQSF